MDKYFSWSFGDSFDDPNVVAKPSNTPNMPWYWTTYTVPAGVQKGLIKKGYSLKTYNPFETTIPRYCCNIDLDRTTALIMFGKTYSRVSLVVSGEYLSLYRPGTKGLLQVFIQKLKTLQGLEILAVAPITPKIGLNISDGTRHIYFFLRNRTEGELVGDLLEGVFE